MKIWGTEQVPAPALRPQLAVDITAEVSATEIVALTEACSILLLSQSAWRIKELNMCHVVYSFAEVSAKDNVAIDHGMDPEDAQEAQIC